MTRQICVGGVKIGGGAPVVIQSMLNTKTTDVEGSLAQIRGLKAAGCQIARLSVQNMEAARGFSAICKESELPLVADIHFDYKLAIAAAEGGASKIRINPGNIGGEDRVKAVVDCCKMHQIPIPYLEGVHRDEKEPIFILQPYIRQAHEDHTDGHGRYPAHQRRDDGIYHMAE